MKKFKYTIPRKGYRAPEKITMTLEMTHNSTRAEWKLRNKYGEEVGVGDLVVLDKKEHNAWCVIGSELHPAYTCKGIYPYFVLPTLRKALGPIYSDRIRTESADRAWAKVKGVKKIEAEEADGPYAPSAKGGYRWKLNPLYRTGKYILKTKEKPEGRSNKVQYFREGQRKPWKKHVLGPQLEQTLALSDRQAQRLIRHRNPRGKTKLILVKCGRKTLELKLLKRSR